MQQVGVVLIGRNEGQRLVDCLDALHELRVPIVYVDSGSTDGSQSEARNRGAIVVDLDLSKPFTAARARNSGFRELCQHYPDIEFVQFIDGDCVLDPGWMPTALLSMENDPKLAVACGRRRERHPEASPYNQLCDLEWDTPIGLADACGGDALMRRSAFEGVGGFNEGLIAGEEPELCLRLRKSGWLIRRLDAEMTLHDAAMTRVGQWWQRARRAGHAFGENSWVHRADGMWKRETRSILIWGIVVPLVALSLAYFTWGASLLLLLAYPVLIGKIAISRWRKRRGKSALLYATSCIGAKFPQALGLITYHRNRLRGRRAGLIEYKGPAARSVT
jgi:GT2 family glycosyltransferase